VSDETSYHLLHVLRMKPGTQVVLSDGLGTDYLAELCANTAFAIKSTSPCLTEPVTHITLYQALLKGDKMDLVIQKCVELGVFEIRPVQTERSVSRIKGKDSDAAKKTTRYQKISESAAGQSNRGRIPVIHPPVNFDAAVKSQMSGLTLLAYEREQSLTLKSALTDNPPSHINIWIGPEGGFSDDEASALLGAGAIPVTLGRRILRAETAAISAVAQIICLCEEA